MTSVDEDLARVTSQSLSMGSSVVTNLESSSCVLPRKLHPSLYNNSMSDVSMTMSQQCKNTKNDNNSSSCGGTPGFPDFPDCWQGETCGERDNSMRDCADKNRGQKWKTNPRSKRQQQRQLVRKAVNINGTKPAGTGKKIKKRLRDERRMRRIEKVVKLQERRRRKRDMGNICQGLASIKC
eukprot:CAMPEP_0172303790 /NCGR_PEP_ID=MMETSP1058-20130122/5307_1 /TAXON_ID=83371 /ORGANISM="Detonula confervacea, Strain CCMP 353" /LENGTH=180 /DNA_ID=CAMNT_0013014771 /DNA_START=77 /DNA_END=619 /DNA_ORIENTATION=+